MLGPNLYHVIHYENLVAHPADECAALCNFLGVSFEDGMLRFHEGRTQRKHGLSTKDAWLPITPGLRDWKTQMRPDDVERFELSAGDLLDELGYPRTAQIPRPEKLEGVSRIRDLFAEDVQSHGELLPSDW